MLIVELFGVNCTASTSLGNYHCMASVSVCACVRVRCLVCASVCLCA